MLRASLVASFLVLSVPASAAPIIFFGEDLGAGGGAQPNADAAQADFLSMLSGVSTEDFESIAAGTTDPALSFNGSAGTINATLAGGARVINSPCCGRFATSGAQLLEADAANFDISFGTDVAAFGFFGTDIGDFGGALTVTIDGVAYDVGNTLGAAEGSVLFWGIIDTAAPFTTISFSNSDFGDVFGFDDMTVGDIRQVVPTPEPGALGLLGLGLLGLAARRRRRA
jgi:hypothetical protein